ncbi:DUF371 domain-containing protein [Candidatus Woesearchaeota archaeon]|nr:DUF371 domain-containing protein [Candidatus Woesearchaeota archaeon]
MKYTFTCKGHENLLGTHRNTFEFTKDKHLTKKGDCIVGVEADFVLDKLTPFLTKDDMVITIVVNSLTWSCKCTPNKAFHSNHEIVCRRGDFDSKRTLGLRCDKAAIDIPRELLEPMKNPSTVMHVTFHNETKNA